MAAAVDKTPARSVLFRLCAPDKNAHFAGYSLNRMTAADGKTPVCSILLSLLCHEAKLQKHKGAGCWASVIALMYSSLPLPSSPPDPDTKAGKKSMILERALSMNQAVMELLDQVKAPMQYMVESSREALGEMQEEGIAAASQPQPEQDAPNKRSKPKRTCLAWCVWVQLNEFFFFLSAGALPASMTLRT